TEIADRSHSLKLLHELDEDTRQLLARFTIARTLGEPLKLAVRRHFDTNRPARAPRSPTNTSPRVAVQRGHAERVHLDPKALQQVSLQAQSYLSTRSTPHSLPRSPQQDSHSDSPTRALIARALPSRTTRSFPDAMAKPATMHHLAQHFSHHHRASL